MYSNQILKYLSNITQQHNFIFHLSITEECGRFDLNTNGYFIQQSSLKVGRFNK